MVHDGRCIRCFSDVVVWELSSGSMSDTSVLLLIYWLLAIQQRVITGLEILPSARETTQACGGLT